MTLINIQPQGKNFHVWLRDKNGKKTHKFIKTFKPYFYYSTSKKNKITNIKDVELKYVSMPSDVKNERNNYPYTFEADVLYYNRYLIDSYYNKTIEKVSLRTAFIDIETQTEGNKLPNPNAPKTPITAITIYDSFTKKYYTFAWHTTAKRKNVVNSEELMLRGFIKFWKKHDFDIVTGWNIDNFDIPYIINRLKLYGLENELSQIKKIKYDKYKKKYSISGISILDYMWLYKKYTINLRESYSLKYISNFELGDTKIGYEGSLNDLWENDINTFLIYNKKDVELVKKLDDKLQFIGLIDEIRRLSKTTFEDAMMNSKVIDNILLCELKKQNKVACTKKQNQKEEKYSGAYVSYPKIGLWKWIIDLDWTSLYPFIIMNLNISPETKNNNGTIVASNGIKFLEYPYGLFPFILKRIFEQRKKYKKLYKENKGQSKEKEYYLKQYALKILLNSFYGFVGFSKSRFYDKDLAEAITITGQEIIKHTISVVENKGYINIATDTDSVLFHVDCNNKNEASIIGKEVVNEINNNMYKFCKDKFNINKSTFYIKQDCIAKTGIFLTKKRYALKVVDEEGMDVKETIIKGMEIVRSDTPMLVRNFLRDIIEMILDLKEKKEVIKYVENFKKKIIEVPPEQIAIPCTIVKDTYKNLPIHINGARYWNEYFEPKLGAGNKGRYLYIKNVPNNFRNNYVITLPENKILPTGFTVDYEKMINRLVNNKIEDIFEAIGWSKQKKLW